MQPGVRIALTLVIAFCLLAAQVPVALVEAADCEFVLGFRVLHELIPEVVGECRVNEHHNPQNGDGLQETDGANRQGGLLVWRKADNWTAYTDGYWTWVNGPHGLQKRLNIERFAWESDGTSAANPASASSSRQSPNCRPIGPSQKFEAPPGGREEVVEALASGALIYLDFNVFNGDRKIAWSIQGSRGQSIQSGQTRDSGTLQFRAPNADDFHFVFMNQDLSQARIVSVYQVVVCAPD